MTMLAKLTPEGTVGRYPYDLSDLLADHPATSFPQLDLLSDTDLAAFGVVRVLPANPPEHNEDTHRPIEQAPALVGGAWVQQWSVVERPVSRIAARRAEAWERVKAERTRRVNGGVLVSGHWYHTDVDSRVQHMRLDAKAAALLADGGAAEDILTVAGQPVYWKTLSNGLVPMTAGLAQAIPVAIEVLDAQAFARAEALRAQIEVSENPESIDITTGWPSTYAVRNINTGTYDELLDIHGIGPVITQAIIDGRPWASVSDLISIPAVDQTLLDVLAPHLSV